MSSADKTKLNGIATGATANTGTVTSVTIKTGTGLSSSSTSAITTSGTRTISIASGYKLPSTTEWSNVVTKSGTETISGTKTFTGGINFDTWGGTLGGDVYGNELIYAHAGSLILAEDGSDNELIYVSTDSKCRDCGNV